MLNMKKKIENKTPTLSTSDSSSAAELADRRVRDLAREQSEIESGLNRIEHELGIAFTGHDDDALRSLRSDRDALQRRLAAVKEDYSQAVTAAARATATDGLSYIETRAARSRAAFTALGPRLEAAGTAFAEVWREYEEAAHDHHALGIRSRDYQLRHGPLALELPHPRAIMRLSSMYLSSAAAFAAEVERVPEFRAQLGEHATDEERHAAETREASSKARTFTFGTTVGGQEVDPAPRNLDDEPVVASSFGGGGRTRRR